MGDGNTIHIPSLIRTSRTETVRTAQPEALATEHAHVVIVRKRSHLGVGGRGHLREAALRF